MVAAETAAGVVAAEGRVRVAGQATVDAVVVADCEERAKAGAEVVAEEVEVDTPRHRCNHCHQGCSRANAVGAEAMEAIRAAAVAWAVMAAEGAAVAEAVHAAWVEMMVVVEAEMAAVADVEVVAEEVEAEATDQDTSKASRPGRSRHIRGSSGTPHTSRRNDGRVG